MKRSLYLHRIVSFLGVLLLIGIFSPNLSAQTRKNLAPDTFRTVSVDVEFSYRYADRNGLRKRRSTSKTVTVACSLTSPVKTYVGKLRRQGRFRGTPLPRAIKSLRRLVRVARLRSELRTGPRRDELNWSMYKAIQKLSPCDNDNLYRPPFSAPLKDILVAEFEESTSTVINEGDAVTFTVVVNEEVDSARFIFGDGMSEVIAEPASTYTISHTYLDSGIYTVSFTGERGGVEVGAVKLLQVENLPPEALVDSTYDTLVNTPLSFSANVVDVVGDAVTYHWDFGDGNEQTEQFPTHIYTTPGTFTATLTVTDDDGGTSSETIEVTVNYYGADPNCELELPEGTNRIYVSSAEELDSATQNLEPGDAVVIRPGIYDFNDGEIFRIPARSSGTEKDRVYLIAETPGTVTFTGNRIWYSFAKYLTTSGITFRTSGGSFRLRADHQRFTCNLISQSTGGLGLYASHLEVDNNTWTETVGDNIWAAQPSITCTNCDYNQFHHIHHNTWKNIERTLSNGGETIRLGYGYWPLPQSYDDGVYATIEWNYFHQANGDAETISVKSSNNTISNNCFHDNGNNELTIRMGHRNAIAKNQFWDGKSSAVRISGNGNIIDGNYFDNVSGSPAAVDLHNGGANEIETYGHYTYIDSKDNIISDNVLNNYRFLARDYPIIGSHFLGYSDNNTFMSNKIFLNRENVYKLDAGRSSEEFEASLNLIDNEFLEAPEPASFQPCYTQAVAADK